MTDYAELVTELKTRRMNRLGETEFICSKAATAIEALSARARALEEALRPFAEIGREVQDDWDDDAPMPLEFVEGGAAIEDFRRAAATLEDKP